MAQTTDGKPQSELLMTKTFLNRTFLLLSLLAPVSLNATEPAAAPEPPAWIKPVFDRGLTKLEFYDPVTKPQKFPGWTNYKFELNHRFTYEYDFRETTKKESSKKRIVVTIIPTFTMVELPVRHQILLPERYDTPRVWDAPLAQHELEHVAISAHHRVALLAKHLVKQIQKIERTIDKPSQITDDWVKKLVDELITPRREALDALLTANNRQLDKLTGHGARPLPDRDAFFSQMYLKENLDEMKFPFLPDVLDLLKERRYQEALWESPPP